MKHFNAIAILVANLRLQIEAIDVKLNVSHLVRWSQVNLRISSFNKFVIIHLFWIGVSLYETYIQETGTWCNHWFISSYSKNSIFFMNIILHIINCPNFVPPYVLSDIYAYKISYCTPNNPLYLLRLIALRIF